MAFLDGELQTLISYFVILVASISGHADAATMLVACRKLARIANFETP